MTTISSSRDSSRLLRSTLLANGIFSFLSGLDFVLFSRPVAEFLGLSSPLIIIELGIALIAYGLLVFSQSRRQPVSRSFAWFAIIADLLWVLGSAALIFTDFVAFTTLGKWAIAIMADIVLVFAILQYVGLRRIGNG